MEVIRKLADDEIIELYFNRDERAILETDRSYGKELLHISYRVLYDREDSKEICNDTYMTAWQSIPPVRPLRFAAWLMKVCRNHALDLLEKKKAKKRQVELVELTDELADCIPDKGVEEIVEAKELGRIISTFLRRLSEEDRFIIMRRCFRMDSTAEIARALECSEGKVRTSLWRTRKELKRYLEKEVGIT